MSPDKTHQSEWSCNYLDLCKQESGITEEVGLNPLLGWNPMLLAQPCCVTIHIWNCLCSCSSVITVEVGHTDKGSAKQGLHVCRAVLCMEEQHPYHCLSLAGHDDALQDKFLPWSLHAHRPRKNKAFTFQWSQTTGFDHWLKLIWSI